MPGLWITVDDLLEDVQTLDYAQEACESASYILWALSGRKYEGFRTITEQYNLQPAPDSFRFIPGMDVYFSDPESNAFVFYYPEELHNKIRTRSKFIVEIVEIHYNDVDNTLIDPDTYKVWDHSVIVFDNPPTMAVNVTYTFGSPPPTMGRMAALALAREFALLWGGHADECCLPDRVTNVNRDGVSWTLLDPQDFLEDGRTGVYAVDMFLKASNPDKARARARVFSVDIPRGKRQS